jgi:hypothetical protein
MNSDLMDVYRRLADRRQVELNRPLVEALDAEFDRKHAQAMEFDRQYHEKERRRVEDERIMNEARRSVVGHA